MKKEEIIKIWKEVIHLAWTYNHKKTKKAEKDILSFLNKHEKALEKDSSKYADIVLGFVKDLKWDLLVWRELTIDSIKSDDYIENYFITKNEVSIYNSLILRKEYHDIFEVFYSSEINAKSIKTNLENLNKNFISTLKKLNHKNIAKNLLIFTLFRRKLPLEAINRLVLIVWKYPELRDEYIKLVNISKIYNNFTLEVYKQGVIHYNENNFNTNYINFKVDNTGEVNMGNSSTDASKSWFRTWNAKYEYKQILMDLK